MCEIPMKEQDDIPNRSEFSTNRGKRFIKKECDLRVSEDGANKLVNHLDEDIASEVAERAVEIAESHGRKTVRREDIRNAWKELGF